MMVDVTPCACEQQASRTPRLHHKSIYLDNTSPTQYNISSSTEFFPFHSCILFAKNTLHYK